MYYMAVFFTHSGAIKYNRFLNKTSISSELMPVPRKLSSNCGIGVKFKFEGEINSIISEDIEKIFTQKNKEYTLIYSCD